MKIYINLFVFLFIQIIYAKFDYAEYLFNKFGIEDTSQYVLIYHSKNDVYEKIEMLPLDSAEKVSIMNLQWKSQMSIFLDSVYQKDSEGNFNGKFINFFGDSGGGYESGYYKNGLMDSIWMISKIEGSKHIRNYKNGKEDGIWKIFRKNGILGLKKSWKKGTPIDTSYQWWPNGNILEMEVFRDGETVYHKCFSEDGKDEIPCP